MFLMKRFCPTFIAALFLCTFAISCRVQRRVSSTPTVDKIQERGTLLVDRSIVADVTVAGIFVPAEPGALEDEFFIGVHTDDYYPSYLDKFTTF